MPRVNFYTGPVSELSPTVLREAFTTQVCPWCHRGPFRVLALHASRAHGVDRMTLREWANVFASESVCAPDYSEERRTFSRRQYEEHHRSRIGLGSKPGHTKKLNTAAREAQRARIMMLTPEQRTANARHASSFVSDEQRRSAQEKAAAARRGHKAPHGTRTRFQLHKCRCRECVEAAASYKREWRRWQRDPQHQIEGAA